MRLIGYKRLKPEKGIEYSRVHTMRLVKAGKFPAPVQLGDNRIAWVEEEVDRYISDRAALRPIPQAA